jgi:soluble lytic murein transglycosylase
MRNKNLLALLIVFFIISLSAGILALQLVRETGTEPYEPDEPAGGNPVVDVAGDAIYYWHILNTLQGEGAAYGEEKLEELAQQVSVLGYEANIILAERLAAQGTDPLPYYMRALEIYNSPELRRQLASYLSEQGLYNEAVTEYLKLLPDADALEALAALEADPALVGEALIAGRFWLQAADFLEPYINEGTDGVAKYYTRALIELGNYKKALAYLQPWADKETDRDILWWFARSLEAAGQLQKAIQIYTSLGETGAYRLGVILEQQGKTAQAAGAFARSAMPVSRWRAARIWDESGETDKALEVYLSLAREKSSYQDDAAYRAYILLSGNGGEDADEMLKLLSAIPAWMKRLGREPSWQTVPNPEYETPDFLLRVDAFRGSGLDYPAGIELAIGTKNADAVEKIALAQWYLAQGQYFQAVRLGSSALADLPCRKAYELAYPRPFSDYVFREAEAFKLDPYLVWAVMREESHFRPEVASRAGALGLMQIMPATGRGIATGLRVDFTEKDLLTPELNIRFGAYYLRNSLNMFGGDTDKALAAYNGGGGNVRRWVNSKTGASDQGFPTAVAFFETREYITKVKNSYYIYKWLYEH